MVEANLRLVISIIKNIQMRITIFRFNQENIG